MQWKKETLPAACKRLRPSAGVPQPDIVWYKDAVPIGPVKYPRYRVLVGGSLQVNGLLPDDTGMFQCFARNAAGEVQTNTYLAVTSECSRNFSLNLSFSIITAVKARHVLLKLIINSYSNSVNTCAALSGPPFVRFIKRTGNSFTKVERNSQQQDGEREGEYICSLNSSLWCFVQLLPQI